MASSQPVTPLRGVNLGGWLVLEPWLTPGLFAGSGAPDEYTFCQQADTTRRRALSRHYQTFITAADFVWLHEHGIEVVRLPIGHWLFGDSAPFLKTVAYVDQAMAWAEQYGLRVLLDLHTAPGSQNGAMHSGQQGKTGWGEHDTVEQTLAVLERIAKRYGRHPALLGISFLNEPLGVRSDDVLERFYQQAYQRLRPLCRPECWLVFSDAYRPRSWYRRLARSRFSKLYVDYHHYQLFAPIDKKLAAWVQVWRADVLVPVKLRRMARAHPLIIGEWSAALRSEKLSGYNQAKQQLMYSSYTQAQLRTMRCSAAWFYWTYKTEQPGPWSFRHCIEQDILRIN